MYCSPKFFELIQKTAFTIKFGSPLPFEDYLSKIAESHPEPENNANEDMYYFPKKDKVAKRGEIKTVDMVDVNDFNGDKACDIYEDEPIKEGVIPGTPERQTLSDRFMITSNFARIWVAAYAELCDRMGKPDTIHDNLKPHLSEDIQQLILKTKSNAISWIDPITKKLETRGTKSINFIMNPLNEFRCLIGHLVTDDQQWVLIYDGNNWNYAIDQVYLDRYPLKPYADSPIIDQV